MVVVVSSLVAVWSWSWSVLSLGAVVIMLVMATAAIIADGGGWCRCRHLSSMVGSSSPSLMVVVALTMLVMEVGRYVVKW